MFKRHGKWLVMLVVLALLLLALLNVNWMVEQRNAARESGDDLLLSVEMERVIKDMRQQTSLASAQAMEGQELGQRIDAAAQQAQLNPAMIDGIYPQPTQRVGSSAYVEKPTTLILRKVELRTLAKFLYHLTQTPGLTVRQLHLRAPRGDAPSNTWDVDATITALIYAPQETSER